MDLYQDRGRCIFKIVIGALFEIKIEHFEDQSEDFKTSEVLFQYQVSFLKDFGQTFIFLVAFLKI